MGLIDGAMQQQPQPQQPQPAQAQPPQQPMQAQKKKVDPTAYARVITASSKLIYEPGTMKHLLDMIRKNPVPGLAQATLLILGELVKKSNNKIPQEVKTPAAKEIMLLIAELAEAAGIIKNAAQSAKQSGALIAQQIMKQMKINPEQLKQARPSQFQPFVRRDIPAAKTAPVAGDAA